MLILMPERSATDLMDQSLFHLFKSMILERTILEKKEKNKKV